MANANFTRSRTLDDRYGHGTHVAGVVALMEARYPGLSNAEIAQKLIATADPATGFDPPLGRVNAYKAVQ